MSMANYSDTHISLTAPNVFAFKQLIENSNIANCLAETYDEQILSNQLTLILNGTSRWAADILSFEEIITDLLLSGEIVDSEVGSDFFTHKTYINGELSNFTETAFISREHILWNQDLTYWYENFAHIWDYPEEYPQEVALALEFNIITPKELDEYRRIATTNNR